MSSQNNILFSWGQNDDGQLGDGTNTDKNIPVKVSVATGLSNVTAIAGGVSHSLAINSSGQAWAWGLNSEGQLGDGSNADSNTPVKVSSATGLTKSVAIAGSEGGFHSLAIDSNGQAWAWGDNEFGQLGNGDNTDSNTPVQVSGLTNAIAIAAGIRHSLAIDSNGQAWAWGANNDGQLGDGSNTDSDIPVQVSGLSNVIAISAGGRHSLAIDSNGQAWAWGTNTFGQLGDGTSMDSNTPVQVSGLTNAIDIDGGNRYSLAIDSNGQVWAWGDSIR